MINLDTFTNSERMKLLFDWSRIYRLMNQPDVCCLLFIYGLINQFQLEGFSKEAIYYAIKPGKNITDLGILMPLY